MQIKPDEEIEALAQEDYKRVRALAHHDPYALLAAGRGEEALEVQAFLADAKLAALLGRYRKGGRKRDPDVKADDLWKDFERSRQRNPRLSHTDVIGLVAGRRGLPVSTVRAHLISGGFFAPYPEPSHRARAANARQKRRQQQAKAGAEQLRELGREIRRRHRESAQR